MVNGSVMTKVIHKGAVHFSARNLQCNYFLTSSLNGIFFHKINHMVIDYRKKLFPESYVIWVIRKKSIFGHPLKLFDLHCGPHHATSCNVH